MMWDCIIIGGGCSGLAAATKLAEQNLHVLLLEKRSLLGGRASSWVDRQSGETVDNGQHMFLGCYEESKTFLKRIGSDSNLHFWEAFSTPMMGPQGERAHLKTWNLPAPWHLGMGLLNYRALPIRQRLFAARVARSVQKRPKNLAELSVDQWLETLKQGHESRTRLWDLITLATLNISPKEAPADLLATVLEKGFLASREASRIGLSKVGLSELHGEPSKTFLYQRGSELRLGEGVVRVSRNVEKNQEVILAGGKTEKAKNVIVAIPPPALRKLFAGASLESHVRPTEGLRAFPILSVHAWCNQIPFLEPLAGFWDQNYHWAFRKDRIDPSGNSKHISLVTSSAKEMLERSNEDLKLLAQDELRKTLRMPTFNISRILAVREREATWCPPLGKKEGRLSVQTPEPGVYLAGDWTDTGLPSTIEGAVKSGHLAAQKVLERMSR